MPKPSQKALGKRKAPSAPSGSAPKKSKGKGGGQGKAAAADEREVGPTGKPKRKPDQPKKIKLRDQKVIPVPRTDFDDDHEDIDDLGEDSELEGLEDAGGFLASLDSRALSRTTKETKRIHALEKAREVMPTKPKKAKAPSMSGSDLSDYDFDSEVDFSDDDMSSGEVAKGDNEDDLTGSDFDSGFSDVDDSDDDEEDQDERNAIYDDLSESESEDEDEAPRKRKKQDEEAEYETSGRARWTKDEKKAEEEDHLEVGRLPIKLPTGEVKIVAGTTNIPVPATKKPAKAVVESDDEEESEAESEASDTGAEAVRVAGQPGRFGRMGISEIVGAKGWKNARRLEAAKEQLAGLGAEILAGGELIDIGPVLTRLSTYGLPTVPNPDADIEGEKAKLPVPNSIRAMAMLSQLAVFKDLAPGYRIRALTEQEETEKVRDEVRRLREGEKMLVRNYKAYLKSLESEVKGKTPLMSVALKCLSELLAAIPHFNFSENIMGVLVGRIGRRSWDADSEVILNTFVTVFRRDVAATYSQALVKLIARMIKERKFQVHANVLQCLLHLRLRTELGAMRDGKKKGGRGGRKEQQEKKFKSEVRKQWQTKNARKKEKELKEIQKEIDEAAAEVDVEEREVVQTETLKNLFVLYFSILKWEGRSPLLSAALEGITHFAHMINIDFFRDLLVVLRRIIADRSANGEDDLDDDTADVERVRVRMLGIATAFELLSGQGEALNIDLGDFVTELFGLLRPLALDTGVEDPPRLTNATAAAAAVQFRAGVGRASADRPPAHTLSTSALLFRCLEAIFFPRLFAGAASAPPLRAAAFAKRLCECALTFPPNSSRDAMVFVRRLGAREPKLSNLLDTEERMFDGVYRPDMDDPQLTNPYTTSLFELDPLAEKHWDRQVRAEAKRLRDANFTAAVSR